MFIFSVIFFTLESHSLYAQSTIDLIQRFPSTTALSQAQQDYFDLMDDDPRYSMTKLIQINNLSSNINSDGYTWINLASDEYNEEECALLKFSPQTSEYINEQDYYYYGNLVEGDTSECKCYDGSLMLISNQGRKYGSITVDGKMFEILAMDTTFSLLCLVDEDHFVGMKECVMPDSIAEPINPIQFEYQQEATLRNDSPCNLRVLFLYTQNAADRMGGVNGINDLVLKGVNQTNQALKNSNVHNVKVVRADVQFIGIVEDEIGDDMVDMVGSSTIQGLRVQTLSDAVCLITDGGKYGKVLGLSGFWPNPNNPVILNSNLGNPQLFLAHMIVQAHSFATKFTFTHELGHVIGCRHQTCALNASDGCDNDGTFEHGHGWGDRPCWFSKWRNYGSVMHQLIEDEPRDWIRVLHYSNPDISHTGAPTGIADVSDNARWIRSGYGCHVANYFPDPFIPLEANILGEDILCQPNTGTYWAAVNGSNHPFQYEWHVSTDGVNWGNVISTTSYLEILSYNYPIGSKVFLRLKVTDAQLEEVYVFFDVLIGYGDGLYGCMRGTFSQENEVTSVDPIIVNPNPFNGEIQVQLSVEGEDEETVINMYTPAGISLYTRNKRLSKGQHIEQISVQGDYTGPVFLSIQVGSKVYNQIIIKI